MTTTLPFTTQSNEIVTYVVNNVLPMQIRSNKSTCLFNLYQNQIIFVRKV